jgi:hypothetical protein
VGASRDSGHHENTQGLPAEPSRSGTARSQRSSRHARPPHCALAAGDQEPIGPHTPPHDRRSHRHPLLLIGVLSSVHPSAPADSGLAGCTSLSSTHQVAATGYPKIRAQFAGSRWPDLRTAGTAYADLAIQLHHARYTDGYQTVWFYQRLSAAYAKHGQALNART